jgi:biotin synthase-like enzyme
MRLDFHQRTAMQETAQRIRTAGASKMEMVADGSTVLAREIPELLRIGYRSNP